tara:strand:- start:171 stop:875 length:705 start_codon:yes stop_codon:yes gene_type:complete
MTARIEAYLYSSGTTGTVDATASITVTEPGPVVYTATLAAPALFSTALVEWQGLLNAGASGLTGAYSITWDAAAQAVTISATGVASFDFVLHGALNAAWGFSGGGGAGSLTYTGTVQSRARFDDLRFSSGAIVNADDVNLREYTYGRHRAIAWGTVDTWRSQVHVQNARSELFLASYCAAGKIRVYQDETVLTAYSATNLGGYIDAYVIGLTGHQDTKGRVWLMVDLDLSVPHD